MKLVLAVTLALLGFSAVVQAGIPIARNGKASAKIIGPTNTDPVVAHAVNDLYIYLAQVTGGNFKTADGPSVIRILKTIPPDAPRGLKTAKEGFWISARGKTIRIAGGSSIGTAYGIYHFLEKYAGVRWFLPVPDGEYVPKNPNLTVPEGETFSAPAFPLRWVGRGAGRWGVRNGGNDIDSGQVKISNGELASTGFRLEPDIYHTQLQLFPTKRYYSTHPEYFALVNGKRIYHSEVIKLCTSNPEVIKEMARNIRIYLNEHPGVEMISLSPSDWYLWCECDNCRAQDETDVKDTQKLSRRMVVFYNAVAAEVRKTRPNVKFAVGAYDVYTWPPKDESIRLLPDMYTVLCHFAPACLAHPVKDTKCPGNVSYNSLLRAWLKRSSGVLFYEYYWKCNWHALPWPIIHSIAKDIPYFHKIGVKGVYTQFTPDNAYSVGLNYYIAVKLLWDPKADVRALVDEYYSKYFAESAKPVGDYYEMLEQRMAAVKDDIPGDAPANATKVFDAAFLDALKAKLDEAQRAARTETTRLRVSRLQKHLDYSQRLVAAYQKGASGDKAGECEMLGRIIADLENNPQQWYGIVSTFDLKYFLRPTYDNLAKSLKPKAK